MFDRQLTERAARLFGEDGPDDHIEPPYRPSYLALAVMGGLIITMLLILGSYLLPWLAAIIFP
ncbi:hypothetical protein [Acidocella sp.]|uniref:hypothetical protein n=1 Tax=Acidocella sp. TaxID=50710 RepID=UPI0026262C3B|nr:hypothetical protein [Acidocella sp.]